MARTATGATAHSGLYGLLWDREEMAASNGGRVELASGQVYVGSPERLAAFRQGEPVSLRAWDVPEAARADVPKGCVGHRRATAWSDGALQIRVASGEEMLADLEL